MRGMEWVCEAGAAARVDRAEEEIKAVRARFNGGSGGRCPLCGAAAACPRAPL